MKKDVDLYLGVSLNLKKQEEVEWWKKHLVDYSEVESSEHENRNEVLRFEALQLGHEKRPYAFDYVFDELSDGSYDLQFSSEKNDGPQQILMLVYWFFKDLYPNERNEFVLRWVTFNNKSERDTNEYCGYTAVVASNGIGRCTPRQQTATAWLGVISLPRLSPADYEALYATDKGSYIYVY